MNRLVVTRSEKPASTLAQCIVLDRTDQLATKDDLLATKNDLSNEIEKLRLATKADIEAASAKQTRALLFTALGLFTSMVGMWVPVMVGLFG